MPRAAGYSIGRLHVAMWWPHPGDFFQFLLVSTTDLKFFLELDVWSRPYSYRLWRLMTKLTLWSNELCQLRQRQSDKSGGVCCVFLRCSYEDSRSTCNPYHRDITPPEMVSRGGGHRASAVRLILDTCGRGVVLGVCWFELRVVHRWTRQ